MRMAALAASASFCLVIPFKEPVNGNKPF